MQMKATLRDQLMKQIKHNQNPVTMSDDELAAYVRTNVLSLTNELHEALQEIGWKPWATDRSFDRDAFLKELADAYLFLANLVLATLDDEGPNVESVESVFAVLVAERIDRAIKRQHDGYDGVTEKCRGCRRSLDDAGTREVDGVVHCGTCGMCISQGYTTT